MPTAHKIVNRVEQVGLACFVQRKYDFLILKYVPATSNPWENVLIYLSQAHFNGISGIQTILTTGISLLPRGSRNLRQEQYHN